MIFTCKQVSNVVADEHLKKLSPMRRALVCFHLSWCPICKRYNKHVLQMQAATEAVTELEDKDPADSDNSPALSDECKCHIQALLEDLMNEPPKDD